MDNSTLYSKDLGRKRFLQVKNWKGELRVDIREWDDTFPTKKGVSLIPIRWASLTCCQDNIDEALSLVKKTGTVKYEFHIGHNFYVTVSSPWQCVDIRERFLDGEGKLRSTRRGINLRVPEWEKLKSCVAEIVQVVPELSAARPCYFEEDHMNQVGMLNCVECNPNGYDGFFNRSYQPDGDDETV